MITLLSHKQTMEQQPKTNKPPHVLLFPFPAQGHINPIIQFAKRLLSKGVKTTLVTTIYIFNINFPNKNNTTSIEIEAITDGFDEGGYMSADSPESYLDTFKEVGSKSLADLIKKLESEGNNIDALIYDSFIAWASDVAMELGIDSGAFFTQACGVNTIYYHVHKGLISLPPDGPVSVPGLPPVERWETPSFVHDIGPYPGWSHTVFNQFTNIDQARWVFTNSFYLLEKEVIEWMRKMWNLKVIGPTLPSMYLDKRLEDDKDYGINLFEVKHNECMNWLNDKPEKSVVYVAFGSAAELQPEEMEEITWGLIDSDVNFLWVVRAQEEGKLPKDVTDVIKRGKGLVVAWCRQMDVLAHESTGCFVTHCGFNSTLEAICLGVPVVAMPQWTDQITNAKMLDEIWGIGVRVKADEKGIVRRGNLASCIKKIMKDKTGVVIQNNAAKWSELAKLAVDKGGSSDKDINEFIYELKHTMTHKRDV
ncbi:UDP-glycosyltransferase 74G1-like [Bidens hawaiensis]|uniref:UDP-glycosyltransferase 74G1-like n=1 Tax=Bidens hawaiensis TaxID=980011 RepID=UPI004049B740